MRDEIYIGSSPHCEECAQVGQDNYFVQARWECRAYINQLRRMFGEEPAGASLSVKSNPHDFGTYLSVVCYFDPELRESVEYALRCEGKGPELWDDDAHRELAGPTAPQSERSSP